MRKCGPDKSTPRVRQYRLGWKIIHCQSKKMGLVRFHRDDLMFSLGLDDRLVRTYTKATNEVEIKQQQSTVFVQNKAGQQFYKKDHKLNMS